MALSDIEQKHINDFLEAIEPLSNAYTEPTFSYLATRRGDNFILVQGKVFLGSTKIPSTHFQSQNVRAGNYCLSELGLDIDKFIENLIIGELQTPGGPLHFPRESHNNYRTHFTPFHPNGLQNQHRLNLLRITGDHQTQYLPEPFLDWELKAQQIPYDGIQELMNEYKLGLPHGDSIGVEFIAFNIASVDYSSPVSGNHALIKVRLAPSLLPERLTLGYRAINQNNVYLRGSFK